MNYAHKALDQCLALRKVSIVLKQKEGKGRDTKGRGGEERGRAGKGKEGEKKEAEKGIYD